jgi:L-lysine 2,3-aminomutase
MTYVRKTISLPKDILETGKERARQFRLAVSRHLARLIEEDNPTNFLTELKRRNVSKVADCLGSRRVPADADSDAGFSISRNSELGDPAGLHRRTDQLPR